MYKITEKVVLNPTVTKMVIEAPLIAKKAKLWLTRAKNCGIIIDVAGNARHATMDLRP